MRVYAHDLKRVEHSDWPAHDSQPPFTIATLTVHEGAIDLYLSHRQRLILTDADEDEPRAKLPESALPSPEMMAGTVLP